MIQRFAEDEAREQPAGEELLRGETQTRDIWQTITDYVRANPTEALAIAGGGAAFVIGALIALPLMQSKQQRIANDFERRVRQAYDEAQQAQESSWIWDKLMEKAGATLARHI